MSMQEMDGCFKDVEDPTLEKCDPREQIGSFLNAQACHRLPNSVLFDSGGEACRPCCLCIRE